MQNTPQPPAIDLNITFDQAAIGAAVVSLNGQWLQVNQRLQEILGYSKEELLATDWQSLTHPEDLESDQKQVEALLAGHLRQYEMEKRYICKSGKKIWALLSVTLIRDEKGRPLHFLSQIQDIDGRKQALSLLKENKLRFDELARNSKTVLWQIDQNGLYTYISEVVEDLLGYSPEELVGKAHYYDFFPDDQRALFLETADKISQAKKTFRDFENCAVAKDGRIVWMSTNGIPLLDNNGLLLGYQGWDMDITDRKLNEDRLRQLSERLLLAKQAGKTGIWDWDITTDQFLLDRESLQMFGLPPENTQPTYQLWLSTLHPKDRERVNSKLQATLNSTRTEFHTAFRVIHPNGEIRHLNTSALIERDNSFKAIRMVGATWDVTEAKTMEVQFLRSQRMESIGTLAGGIAHNLNNALTPAMLALDILKEKIKDPSALNLIQTINKSTQQAATMVRQILSFARGVEGSHEVLKVDQLTHDLSRIILATFPPNIRLEIKISPELWTVIADPTQIHQTLLNLCLNARDAMPQGGMLRISVENHEVTPGQAAMHDVLPGPYLLIRVEDTGCGMSEQTISQLFNPFFTTKGPSEGTGLGLPSALGIVKGHHGFIEVFSEPGAGAQFHVYLPAGENTTGDEPAQQSFLLSHGGEKTILLVDDNEPVRRITAHTLELYGYRVVEAENGHRALEYFKALQDELSLVLTDIMMPEIDGLVFISQLRKLKPEVPVIAISGAHTHEKELTVKIDPFLSFLPKPFDTQTLLRTIQDSLQTSP